MNIDINYQKLFESMCKEGHLDDAKKLYEINPTIDISDSNEEAFRLSCKCGHLDVVKWL